MSEPLKMPMPEVVAKVMSQLLGTSVAARKLVPAPPADVFRTFSTFVTKAETVVLIALTDIAFGASCGAALSMIPAGVAVEAIRLGRLEEGLVENLREVANVLTVAFNVDKGVHIRLKDMVVPKPPLPPAVQGSLTKARERLDLEVAIRGYPNGRITFLLA